jgi:hypothetical protein
MTRPEGNREDLPGGEGQDPPRVGNRRHTRHDLRDRPDLAEQIPAISRAAWPAFLLHSNVTRWETLARRFPEFQFVLCDPADTVIAVGHTLPVPWNGSSEDLPDTINEAIARANAALDAGIRPQALCALAAMIRPDRRGRGLSYEIIGGMRDLARRCSLGALLAPVRPAQKALDPHAPMEEYAHRLRPDGTPVDPWIRVHRSLGARFRRVMPSALVVEGTVADWEEWTGMRFPATGRYEVPGALAPVAIDRESDRGRYEDPNYWMVHTIDAATDSPGGPR